MDIARRLLLMIGSLALSGLLAPPTLAYDEKSTSPLNLDKSGVILKGYDPVAYFTDGKPVKGSATISATHGGAVFHFATEANRAAFLAEPGKYVPQYGGYCAMGVVSNYKVDIDPKAFKIENGKLYLNLNRGVQKDWLKDVPGNITKADQNWPRIKDKAPKDL